MQEVVEISSDSHILPVHSPAYAALQPNSLSSSTEGLQGATAIPSWAEFFWQRMEADDRRATQAACYFIRSDVRWYCKALPMWNPARQRILEPDFEQVESEHGTDDIYLPDSEAGAIYHVLPREAGWPEPLSLRASGGKFSHRFSQPSNAWRSSHGKYIMGSSLAHALPCWPATELLRSHLILPLPRGQLQGLLASHLSLYHI